MTIYERIEQLRKAQKISQGKLEKELGFSNGSVSKWKNSTPTPERLQKIADYFNVTVDYLMTGKNNVKPSTLSNIFPIELKRFPMAGEIACGIPKYANEDRESYVMAGTNIKADFCLRASGDSMINARILDGDIVFIKKQDMVENGEIAAVVVNSYSEATLKRIFYYPEKGLLILKPENPAYEDFIFTGEELNQVHILGKAIAFQSDVK